jgi:hypothetical protein
METFYATLSQTCFAALGLWWVVVQFKYDRWSGEPARRAAAGAISGQFIALGVLALIAVLSTEVPVIWRIGSITGGLLGALAALIVLTRTNANGMQRAIGASSLVLFVLVFLTAFTTTPIFGLRPIIVESLIDCALLALAVWQAWTYMMDA